MNKEEMRMNKQGFSGHRESVTLTYYTGAPPRLVGIHNGRFCPHTLDLQILQHHTGTLRERTEERQNLRTLRTPQA